MDLSINSLISVIGVITFALLIPLSMVRWRLKGKAFFALFLYLGVGLILNIGLVVQAFETPPDFVSIPLFLLLTDVSRVALPLALGALSWVFLSRRPVAHWYWGFSLLILGLWVIIQLDLINIQPLIANSFPTNNIVTILGSFALSVAAFIFVWVSLATLKQRRQAQFRNWLYYWIGGILMLLAANMIMLLQNPDTLRFGSILNIAGASLITYIVSRSHLPNLQVVIGRLLYIIFVIALQATLLFTAFYGIAYLTDSVIYLQNVFIGFVIIAVILSRFSRWLEKGLTKAFLDIDFDESSIIKAYSQNVSAEWSFEKLGQQALTFILQELNINRGALFVNEGDGSGHVTLKLIAAVETPNTGTGYFFANDPWIVHMRQAKTAVTQYDLDILPEYKVMDENSKIWLAALDMEIFFPVILRQRELIGVLALGTKPNNRPYRNQDLNRIDVLTSQLALDIDKAKMFTHLGTINQKMGEMSEQFATLQSDEGKTDFLSIASHELRTPLNHIHGYAGMLMEATEEELQSPAYLKHIFNGIAKGSSRLNSVVDLIFDVSMADIGELELIFNTVNLDQSVEEAIENQAEAIQQRQHKLVISGLDQLPSIQADPSRLVQAIEQLVNNAVKYTPDGGTITITGRAITEKDQPHVELIVTDTGIGIDPADHSQIFEKFYRVDDINTHSTGSIKFKGAGPGLGLALVAGITKAHGGRVWVESPKYDEEACPGSQFHLILPVEPREQPVDEVATKPDVSPSMAETRHWRSEDMKAIKRLVEEQKVAQENDAETV